MKLYGQEVPAPTYEPLGKRLKEVRKHHKLTQPQVSELFSISRSSYQNYERDERDMPISLVKSFIRHFRLNSEWFLFGDAGRDLTPEEAFPLNNQAKENDDT